MRLFTSSHEIYIGDALADTSKNKTIYQPHASMYGTTTPAAFYEALTASSLADGLLSRVLVFEGDDEVSRVDIERREAPAGIVEQAKWWGHTFQPGGNLAAVNPQPVIIGSTQEARLMFADLDAVAEEERKAIGEPLGSLWPRTREKAHKLALLWACSETPLAPVVDEEAALWACSVVKFLTRRLSYLASRWIAENRQEANVKRLARMVEAAGAEGLHKWKLGQQTRFLTTRDRDELLKSLRESGDIVERTIVTKTRPRTVFVHRKFVGAKT